MTKNKIVLLLLIICFVSLESEAQNEFYNTGTIQQIEITFTQPNWDYMLDTAAAGSEGYIMAKKVKINGFEFDSVGVKYKGNSSYNPNQVKNPFHIELDTYKDQDYEGYTDIKLGNGFKDPSFLREVLSYKILRNYMSAPQSNFANVYVNDQLIGLYSNSESVGKKFVNDWFGSKTNTFIKCNPVAGAGPGSNLYPNLVYLGSDSSLYYNRYELESDHGWSDLINLCDTLANHTLAIENILNVNQALWMLAFDNVLVNLDSYLGGFTQNYYLYKDDYGRFRPVIWDLNESFGTFSMTGTSNLGTTTQKQQMTHLLHSSDNGWPLVKNLLSVPMYKRMYLAHMRTILAENFANNKYYSEGLVLQGLISTSVNADPNKFFSYSKFISNLTTDVNIGNGIASGLTNLMNGRNAFLSALPDLTALQPTIADIMVSDNLPVYGAAVNITANISNALSTGIFLAYRYQDFAPFQRIPMYDDGLHGDGSAGDNIYGATIITNSGKTDYYFYAENSQAGVFSPSRAEMEFYTLFTQTKDSDSLVINEFLASNSSIVADQDGEFDDWIEIFNQSAGTISLDSIYLSDSYNNFQKWKFPDGSIILPKSYIIVWADEDGSQNGLHANFKLSASGERIVLSHSVRGVLDSISFGFQTTDISMQRCPNDTGAFVFAAPSFGTTNNCPTIIEEENSDLQIAIYPNPFSDRLYINTPGKTINSFRIINLAGQTLLFKEGGFKENFNLDLSQLPKGLYLILLDETISRKILKN